MKQKIFLLMALIAAITLSACSSNDDDNSANSSIVGTWYAEDDGYGMEFKFLPNSTVYATETMLSAPTSKVRDTGTYQLNGNKLTIRWTKSESWSTIGQTWNIDDTDTETVVLTIRISDNTLTFYSMEGEDAYTPIVFTRK